MIRTVVALLEKVRRFFQKPPPPSPPSLKPPPPADNGATYSDIANRGKVYPQQPQDR